MGILEFLSIMTQAQEVAGLSDREFLEQLKQSTTGNAHILIMGWVQGGETAESIYHLLGCHYDYRITASDARKSLYAYWMPKNIRINDGYSGIMYLAARVASQIPEGESRNTLYNLEATQGILRALPPVSAATAQNTYATLSAR